MKVQMRHKLNENGFTIVELMVVLAISIIVITATYAAIIFQQQIYISQERVTAMQQNLRAGANLITMEIREAGYADPDDLGATAGVLSATDTSFSFEKGTDTIIYSYDNANLTMDRDINGSGPQEVAENIEALGFAYAFDANDTGDLYRSPTGNVVWAVASGGSWFNLDTNDDGVIDANDSPSGMTANTENITGTDTGIAVDLSQIRAVKVWLIARTSRVDSKFTNTRIYIAGNQKMTFNDGFRRRLLTSAIKCRNLELK